MRQLSSGNRNSPWQPEIFGDRPRVPALSETDASYGPYTDPHDEAALDYWEILRHRKWQFLTIVAAAVGLAWMYQHRQVPAYRARTTIEVQALHDNILHRQDLDPAAREDSSSQTFINTQGRTLQSTPVAQRVIDVLEQEGKMPKGQLDAVTLASLINVRTHDTDRLLDVTFDWTNPQLAADVLNVLSTEFIKNDLDARVASSHRTAAWLGNELDALRNKLSAAEQNLIGYTQENHLILEGGDGSEAGTKLLQQQSELSRVQADRAARQATYDTLSKYPAATLTGALLGDPLLDQYHAQSVVLRRELAELAIVYGPDYDKVQQTNAQLVELDTAIKAREQALLIKARGELETSQRRQDLVAADHQKQLDLVAEQSAKLVHYQVLRREMDTDRTIYEDMLQKVQGFSAAALMQTTNLRVIEPAAVPQFPFKPNRPLIVGMGLIGGCVLGLAFVFLSEARTQSIQKPGQTSRYLSAAELGVIPSASAERNSSRGLVPLLRRRSDPVEIIAWKQKISLLADSFRSVTASLLLSKRFQNQGLLVITSLSPEEGKTTIASNLAIAIAGATGPVLLIDADRRRGRIHEVFHTSNDVGLGAILREETPLENYDWKQVLQPTEVPNLFILPRGAKPLETADLLYSQRLIELLCLMRGRFSRVLIDTPPLSNLPDARILGSLSDGVVLVFRAGRTRSQSAIAAQERLREDGIPIAGTILNDWNPRVNGNGPYPDKVKEYAY